MAKHLFLCTLLKTLAVLNVFMKSIVSHEIRMPHDNSNIDLSVLENKTNINLFIPNYSLNNNINNQSSEDSNSWRHNGRKRSRTGHSSDVEKRDRDEEFNWISDDFVITDNLPDGEREKRVRYKGISAKETAAGTKSSGLILRQLAEGRHFVQTISNANGKMIDCEYLKDKETVRKFVKDFNKEISSYFNKNKKSEEKRRRKYKSKRNFITRVNHHLTERENEKLQKHRSRNMKNTKIEKRIDEDIYNIDGWEDYSDVAVFDNVDDVYRDDYKMLRRARSKRDIFSDEDDDLPDYSEYDPVTSLNTFRPRERYGKRRHSKRKSILADNYDKNSLKNVTVMKIEGNLPGDIAEWLNYKILKEKCDRVHEELKEVLGMDEDTGNEDHQRKRTSRSLGGLTIFPGMLWCGGGSIAESQKELGLFQETDNCCRAHDLCPRPNLPSYARSHGVFNLKPFTVSHCKCDKSLNRRTKRATSMLVPGTKWCGRGGSATRHSELGAFGNADRCCRRHDTTCPFWIGAAESKYGLFNWRPNTLMHCRCDERFRSCLKMANSDAANMVGRLFFNVVQTRCFVLKPAKVCLERSWWGKCLKAGYAKQAHLRENPSF